MRLEVLTVFELGELKEIVGGVTSRTGRVMVVEAERLLETLPAASLAQA